MKFIYTLFLILIPIIGDSQNKVSGELELSQFLHSRIYTETNLSFGVNFPLKEGNISLLFQYQYGGNWKTTNNYQEIPMYTLDYHLIGGGIRYRILKQHKIYSPTIQISALTEVESNYRGGYIESKLDAPFFEPSKSPEIAIPSQRSYTYYYVSTPFIGSLIIGNEIRILKGLFINIGIGISMRGVKMRYKEWYSSQPEPTSNLSDIHSLNNITWIKTFDLSLGASYTFSFHKNSKITPKTP